MLALPEGEQRRAVLLACGGVILMERKTGLIGQSDGYTSVQLSISQYLQFNLNLGDNGASQVTSNLHYSADEWRETIGVDDSDVADGDDLYASHEHARYEGQIDSLESLLLSVAQQESSADDTLKAFLVVAESLHDVLEAIENN